ncbi:MAG: Gfo/Idh/MocA family oxidoreductase [Alteromonas macleodii]|jgi:predicted dehydrogenase|uniref:Oxidoreductase, Gfo/Idh/MocA family protein n=1 Tax=Alteromonas macleodii (strain English Channel 673) TaxID=1004788 RepID=A0AB32ZTN4_ALTME|nr:Gfo/Idh/MocA family oxidoreductase [Alteromonas macleodii]AFT72984.1 oxidoreductase, Gfo/Idh/MocA family protein [Alteromonas macleodii str. 'English Channel 673']MBL3811179.1 Gfo/Idh/MocA family oxidoreductase [Alteromonas macleodii]MBL3884717.1 Gfo/Idh/MocA family oxidoreductase [Alteromonas macleodii]MDM7964213.1 Gfo/Idh/MocA family oxidoreductase [Alteromonas macleodii]MDM8172642.1 Gfo/Idh/MocA family oxidoreductase [Alteromonas macleodii]
MQPIRMGMIGGGEGAFIGAVHRHAAGLDGNYQLVCGAFSRNEENNTRTASALNVSTSRTYDSWQSMLEEEAKLPEQQRMQVVVIVTPNHLHVPISLAAIKAGFHVFCEKPAGISFAEVKELQDVIHASESLYGLAHTYLGYPMVWQARHLVESGKLGKIRKVYVEYPQGWLSGEEETHNKQAQWRTDPAISGATGAMGDIGTHAFGLVEFVLNDSVTSLCGELNTHVEGRRLDDDGAALIKTKKGASGVLIASQVCAGEENALKIRVYGDKGGLEWRQMEPNSVIYRPVDAPYQVFRAGQGQVGLCDAASARCRVPAGHPEGYLEAMANLYTDFAKAVRANQKGKADGVPGINSGIRGMVFIDAMLASTDSDTKWESVSQEGTQ